MNGGLLNQNKMLQQVKLKQLKVLFQDYLPKDYIASSFIVSYASVVAGNGEVPIGGSFMMTNRIINKFKSLGGILHCASPVKKICVEGKQQSELKK